MKALARVAGLALAVAAAGFGTGCTTTSSTSTQAAPARDLEIVESSTQRSLTDTEMAEVRGAVSSYLEREGASDAGDYYVKVFLTPEYEGADPEWVVVRLTRYTVQRVSLVGSYSYVDPLYTPYYSYDIYPYGYGYGYYNPYRCVTRLSFQYYVDPYYGHRYYHHPRTGYYGHGKGKGGHHNHGDQAGNHDRDPQGQGRGNQDGGNRPPRSPNYVGNRPGVPAVVPAHSIPGQTDREGQGTPREPRRYADCQPRMVGESAGGVVRPPSPRPDRVERSGTPPETRRNMSPGNRRAPVATTEPRVGEPPASGRDRRNTAVAPNRVAPPARAEARVTPDANHGHRANHRPQASVDRPAPAPSRPSPSYQPAPARQTQPEARSAPQRSDDSHNGGGRASRESSREVLR
jgi:hypothetical protein